MNQGIVVLLPLVVIGSIGGGVITGMISFEDDIGGLPVDGVPQIEVLNESVEENRLTAEIEITNPNPVRFSLNDLSYRIGWRTSNDSGIVADDSIDEIVVPPETDNGPSVTRHRVNLTVDRAGIREIYQSRSLIVGESISITGNFSYEYMIGGTTLESENIEIDQDFDEVPVPTADINITEIDETGARANITIENPTPFDSEIEKLDLDLRWTEGLDRETGFKNLGDASIPETPISIGSRETRSFTLNVTIDDQSVFDETTQGITINVRGDVTGGFASIGISESINVTQNYRS